MKRYAYPVVIKNAKYLKLEKVADSKVVELFLGYLGEGRSRGYNFIKGEKCGPYSH